jgi:hypothetical protein
MLTAGTAGPRILPMNTAKELAQISRLRRERDGNVNCARSWSENDRKYTSDKVCRKLVRDSLKSARRLNRKLVTIKRAGTQRPVSIVMTALLPLIEGVRASAIEFANSEVTRVRELLATNGGNVDAFAPAENDYSTEWDRRKRAERDARRAYRAWILKLTHPTVAKPEGYEGTERSAAREAVRELDADGVQRYERDVIEDAEWSYIAYVFKMDAKVGKVTAARLHGNRPGVWSQSHLIVTTEGGQEVIWRTQQIENRSVLGKYFPQWPSRIVKEVA